MTKRSIFDLFTKSPFGAIQSHMKKAIECAQQLEPLFYAAFAGNGDEIRRIMTNYVGILRSNKRLERARRRLELIRAEVHDDYWDTVLNGDLVELRNIVTVAYLIVECALARRESRGLHFNVDYPLQDDVTSLRNTVIWRGRRGTMLHGISSS